MSMYELPNNLLEEIVDSGMETGWKQTLQLRNKRIRFKAKETVVWKLTHKLTYHSIKNDRNKIADEAVRLYVEVGPLLAENKAITKAAQKNPLIRQACPEILTLQEAIALAKSKSEIPNEKDWLMVERKLRYLLNGKTAMLLPEHLFKFI